MPPHSVDFDTVRKLAHEIGAVEECTVHGAPSLKVRGKLLACIAVHKSAEPGSLVVRIDANQRAKLIASASDVYYVTDHYVNYPTVLVRLSRIQPDALRELLGIACKLSVRNADVVVESIAPTRTCDCGDIGCIMCWSLPGME
jgi:hypothetical protein